MNRISAVVLSLPTTTYRKYSRKPPIHSNNLGPKVHLSPCTALYFVVNSLFSAVLVRFGIVLVPCPFPIDNRYPDRSRQQNHQQEGERRSFDAASAFRNSAAAAAAASADDLYGFSYDPHGPAGEDQGRRREGADGGGGGRRRQRPEQDYPRRNSSSG